MFRRKQAGFISLQGQFARVDVQMCKCGKWHWQRDHKGFQLRGGCDVPQGALGRFWADVWAVVRRTLFIASPAAATTGPRSERRPSASKKKEAINEPN